MKNMTLKFSARFLLFSALALISHEVFAAGGSGFSESTETVLKKQALEQIYTNPKVYQHVVQVLIERELYFEDKEVDPTVVRILAERLLYATSNIPQPPVDPKVAASLPKIIKFMTGHERQTYNRIKEVLGRGNKQEILRFYFNLDKAGRDWQFFREPSTDPNFTNVDVTIPVHQLARGYGAPANYTASFRIDHPMDTWKFDETDSRALLIVDDPKQITLKSFQNGEPVPYGMCEGLFK